MWKPKPSNLSFLLLVMLITSFIYASSLTALALTSLDYHLGHSKYGDASISGDDSFHGSSSAELSVENKGDYIRVSVYMDEPLPLEDLDLLSMWIKPQYGDGVVQLDLFLDGDGDDSYDSHSSKDARVRSLKESWSEAGISLSQWNELDGFDLNYEKYQDKAFGSGSLADCKSKLKGESLVRLYITLYKDGKVPKTTAFIDYIKIGDQIISFEPMEQEAIKKATKSISPGGQITYTITYGNNQLTPIDLMVKEQYDPRTTFIEANPSPDPGSTNVWTFRQLPPGAHGQIVIKVATIKPSCKAKIESEVSGRGYTSVNGLLSTDFNGNLITNSVTISSSEFNLTASADTTVRPIEGSILAFGEHGSGFYKSEEQLAYSPSSISLKRQINGSTALAVVNLSRSSIPIQGGWFAGLQGENKIRDIRWSDKYYHASLLNLSYRVQLSKAQSLLETSSRFIGMVDRTSQWTDIITDQRLAGNFTITSKNTGKWSSMQISQQEEGLDCCPEIQDHEV